jgi:transcriptional regulator with XRE-family HTH domain
MVTSADENDEELTAQVRRIISRIKKERENKGWSQVDLSLRSGLSQNHVFAIESGARIPTLYTLLKLCNALGISPGSLFSPDDAERVNDRLVLKKLMSKYL